MARRPADAKTRSLKEHGCLNPHAETVRDELFLSNAFFETVRYEMLRRVARTVEPCRRQLRRLAAHHTKRTGCRACCRTGRVPAGPTSSATRWSRLQAAMTAADLVELVQHALSGPIVCSNGPRPGAGKKTMMMRRLRPDGHGYRADAPSCRRARHRPRSPRACRGAARRRGLAACLRRTPAPPGRCVLDSRPLRGRDVGDRHSDRHAGVIWGGKQERRSPGWPRASRDGTCSSLLSATTMYALRERAVALLARSLRQRSRSLRRRDREGFQHLVAEVGMGRAGIVLGLEVSRLARNSTDWHRLLEIPERPDP